MPELKHTFTSGRMNKDLDERLVPNGEYRDAQNIEVLTSDGSDMGTAQTCLGNSLISDISPDDNNIGRVSSCVASIADDKTNKIYYFIAGDERSFVPSPAGLVSVVSQDLIAEYNSVTGETCPVMVDIYNVRHEITARVSGTSQYDLIPVNGTQGLRIGMEVDVSVSNFPGWIQKTPRPIITAIPSSTRIELSEPIIGANGVVLTNINSFQHATRVVTLNFTAPRVLKFAKSNLITGVNIIDDMLFWTDNLNEPKKVNITRGKQGSIPNLGICQDCNFNQYLQNPYFLNINEIGTTHTELVVENGTTNNYFTNSIVLNPNSWGLIYGVNEYVQEKHITVIKQSPLTPPKLDMYDRVVRFDPATRQVNNIVNTDFTNWHGNDPDDTGNIILPPVGMTSKKWNHPVDGTTQGSPMAFFSNSADFRVGDILLLTDDVTAAIDANGDPLPFGDPELGGGANDVKIKLRVISSDSTAENPIQVQSPTNGNLNVSVIYVDETYVDTVGGVTWYIRLEDKPQSLYELKFPKFGYRYRYEDGEYSTFSPFSETAFLPSKFEYDSVKGYNKGMTNGLKQLFIKDFIPPNIPLDVVEIDILYKESDSPNIYTIRSFKKTDLEWNYPGTGSYKGNFEIKDDLIHAVVASNQLLRPWDNVPRKALGQEITGNRLIYGNYLQNYDLSDGDRVIKPSFKTVVENNLIAEVPLPETSLKSMRTYQLGIVYKDVYGRETPVLSHPSGVVKVDSSNAIFNNKFVVETTTPPPGWADSFKYFIKEVSNEYYNLAMDRWYDADFKEYDGEKKAIWMSFPSEDRNKVDEETTLILKKSDASITASSGFIETTPRYKILAIESEAPDFIKTTLEALGKIDVTDATGQIVTNGTGPGFFHTAPHPGVPLNDYKQIRIPKEDWEDGEFASLQNHENQALIGGILDRSSSLVMRFLDTSGSFISKWYNVSNISYDRKNSHFYTININGVFKDHGPLFNNVANAQVSDMITGIRVEIAKKTIESRPEFDGRFFVKIESDKELKDVLGLEGSITATTDWGVDEIMESYFLSGATEAPNSYCESTFTPISGNYGVTTLYDNSIYPAWEYQSQGYINWQSPNGWGPLDRLITHNLGTGSSWGCGNIYPLADSGAGWGNGNNMTNLATAMGPPPPSGLDPCDQVDFSPPFRVLEDWVDLLSGNGALPTGGTGGGMWFIDADPALSRVGIMTSGSGGSSSNYAFQMGPEGKGADIGKHEISISFAGDVRHDNSSGDASPNADFSSIHMAHEKDVYDKLKSIGTKFRFANDPDAIVYEIYGVDEENLWNWDHEIDTVSSTTASSRAHHQIRRIRLNLTLIEPGTSSPNQTLAYKAIGQPKDATYTTGSAGFSDPNTYAPCDYVDIGGISNNIGAKSDTSIVIQFVSPIINQQETEYSENPAIWETEPKEDVGLDIYYEASKTYPTNMCDDTEELYIQPGATVSMFQSDPVGTYSIAGWGKQVDWLDGVLAPGTLITGPTTTAIVDSTHSTTTTNIFSHVGGQESVYNTASGNNYILLDAPINPALQLAIDSGFQVWVSSNITPDPIPASTTVSSLFSTIDGRHAITLSASVPTPSAAAVSIPPGTVIIFNSGGGVGNLSVTIPTIVESIIGCAGDIPIGSTQPSTLLTLSNGQVLNAGDILSFTNPDNTIVTATIAFDTPSTIPINATIGNNQIHLNALTHGERHTLQYYNCYAYGNGVESNRVRDLFNAVTIDKGVKASTTLAEQYKEEHRKSGLIFSGIYNSMNGVNRLNQFIMAENITKDLNPEYGSIQKLHSRDDDLITLCEDKIIKVLAHKDALFNADDTKNITASSNVLGYAKPFVGDYGISKNPESFASEAFRAYFTDRERGAVLRLSRDGLTPISDVGMKDWFADNLSTSKTIIGSYDRRRSLYNISGPLGPKFMVYSGDMGPVYDTMHQTVSYSEKSGGWVSFKTINPEVALSLNNDYYTAIKGKLWKHHDNFVDRNSFYDTSGTITNSSHITVLFNDLPSVIKSFTTLNYEGSQSKIIENLAGVGYPDSTGGITFSTDNKHYNNQPKLGWHVNSIITDQQTGTVAEFINKEGKWFNYIIGEETVWDSNIVRDGQVVTITNSSGNLDTREFSTQGIGKVDTPPQIT
jgi:hypothetical protein